jgi:hypothetical protein
VEVAGGEKKLDKHYSDFNEIRGRINQAYGNQISDIKPMQLKNDASLLCISVHQI